jgi:hypothetical protein
MAYPTVSGPYGLQPVNRVDGMPYAGATRTYGIASNYNTAIFNGDLVQIVTGGTIEKFTGTDAGFPVGVFTGVEFTNAQGQRLSGQYYAGTSMANAKAKVVVDSQAVYKVAVTTDAGVMSSASLASIGSNMELVQGTGSTATGNSGVSVEAGTEDTTATFVVRVVDVVAETAFESGGNIVYPELIVKINLTQFDRTTGV